MTDFILEIFSEEIPAKMQNMAAQNLAKIAAEVFVKNSLAFTNSQIKTFVTPRRLTLVLNDLQESQKTAEIKKNWPKS